MSNHDPINTAAAGRNDGDDAVGISNGADRFEPAERTSAALARCMLDGVLTRAQRRLLKQTPRLILIKTADETAARLVDRYLSGMDWAPAVQAYTERRREGGRLLQRGRDELAVLEKGHSIVLISQDPEGILVPEALAGADAVITVPPPDLAVIRRIIRAITGRAVRGLVPSDIEGLGIDDLTTAIRPGLSPRECAANLRRMAEHRRKPDESRNMVRLEQMALTKPVEAWAHETLGIMNKVANGEMTPAALRFACLEGPPGLGKTTLAGALAASAGWTFVSTSVGAWFAESGGHLGDVIRAARRFIDEIVNAKGPVVGLLDEIDAIPNRAELDADRGSWWVPLVTYLLTELDTFRKSDRPVLLLGATNHFDKLDAALIRPGRLERRVRVLLPDADDRRRLFAACLGKEISDDAIATLARLSVKATPAQIESWCTSALAAARAEDREVELRDLVELIAPQGGRTADQDSSVALHEAGHAIVAHELGVPVAEISILKAGTVDGYVNTNLQGRLVTRDEVERMATVMMAGRAADTVLGGGADAGAAGDITAVNNLLRSAMLEFGLYGSLTTAANSDLRNWLGNGHSLAHAIGAEINRLHDRAAEIVSRRRDDIFGLADMLLAERVVTGDRLAEIVGAGAAPDVEASTQDQADAREPQSWGRA